MSLLRGYARLRIGRLIGVFAVALFLLLANESAASDERRVPSKTTVLLLRPIDATIDSARLAPLRQQIIRLRQQYEFICRHFAVLGEAAAENAAAVDTTLNLSSLNQRTAKSLDRLATQLGATWVVSLAVKEIASDPIESFDGSKNSVHCSLEVQIRDARDHRWLVNKTCIAHVTGGASPPELFIESLETVTREALETVLLPYPKTISVSRDGSIVDYLGAESAPVLGEPGKEFTGVSTVTAKPDPR